MLLEACKTRITSYDVLRAQVVDRLNKPAYETHQTLATSTSATWLHKKQVVRPERHFLPAPCSSGLDARLRAP